MKTEVMRIDRESLAYAKKLLLEGQVVAFPTETVYGLGAWAYSLDGIKRIYEAKGRPSDNPLIVHIAPGFDLSAIAREIPKGAEKLMDTFWPGPMTIIMPKNRENILKEVTGGLDTVAIRMPSDPSAMELLKFTGLPIVAPSANTSGRPSPTTAQHVLEDLGGKIPLILDGGPCQVGLESTIVDLTDEKPLVLRPGGITLEMLEDILPGIDLDPAVKNASLLAKDVVPKAPGMKYRHYAPKGHLILTDADACTLGEWIRKDRLEDPDRKMGLIASEELIAEVKNELAGDKEELIYLSLGSRRDLQSIAQNLFSVLREADERGLTWFYGEAFSREGVGEAVMNRFRKASAEQRYIR